LACERDRPASRQAGFRKAPAQACQPDEGIKIRPCDRLSQEAGLPARIEPAERVPDMLKLQRQRRGLKLDLERGALLGLARPLEQTLQDLPVGNAVLERREREGFFSECPQLVAEG
jgi:hypothetical protein